MFWDVINGVDLVGGRVRKDQENDGRDLYRGLLLNCRAQDNFELRGRESARLNKYGEWSPRVHTD